MSEPDERTALPWLSRSTLPDETETPASRMERRTAVRNQRVSPNAATPGVPSRLVGAHLRRLPVTEMRAVPGVLPAPPRRTAHGPAEVHGKQEVQGVPPVIGRPGRDSRIPVDNRRRGPHQTVSRARPIGDRRRRDAPTRDAIAHGRRDPHPETESPADNGVHPSAATATDGHRTVRRKAPVPSDGAATDTRATDRKNRLRRALITRVIFAVPTDRTGSVPRRSTRTSRATNSTG